MYNVIDTNIDVHVHVIEVDVHVYVIEVAQLFILHIIFNPFYSTVHS